MQYGFYGITLEKCLFFNFSIATCMYIASSVTLKLVVNVLSETTISILLLSYVYSLFHYKHQHSKHECIYVVMITIIRYLKTVLSHTLLSCGDTQGSLFSQDIFSFPHTSLVKGPIVALMDLVRVK